MSALEHELKMSSDYPSQLGRYKVLEILGRGAMGVVYLAQDPALNRRVALKTFHVSRDVDARDRQQFRERFLREAQSCGMLNHPNVVTLHDVVELPETESAFMAMEYVRGTNLKQLIQQSESFAPEFVISVVEQIAAGLDYAHSRGVIHRDVKPANILLTEENEAKITDFGIARFNASNLTHAGQLLGTPNYMAPEQIRGGEVDHRADLFSLGVLVYELLTRRKPFQGDNLTMVTHRIVYEEFEAPEQYVQNFPVELRAVLSKALAKKPEDRYPDATTLAEDLRAAIGPPPSPSPDALNDTQDVAAQLSNPPSSPPLPRPPVGSEDTQPSSVPLAPPLPSAAKSGEWRQQLDGVLDQTRTLLRKALPPESRPPRRRVAAYVVAGAVLLALGLVGVMMAQRQLRPGLQETLESQRMQWASAFSGLMVAGAQELEQGQPISAVDRFQEARRMLDSRREELRTQQEKFLAEGKETVARSLAADLETLENLDATSAEALEKAEWRREESRAHHLLASASAEKFGIAQEAYEARKMRDAREAVFEALALDPGNEEAIRLLAELGDRGSSVRLRPARPRALPPPPPPVEVPSPVAPTVDQQEAVVPQEATLAVHLVSDLQRGVLLIYLDEAQLLRESFRFGEKGRLFRRSKAETGRFRKTLKVSPGSHTLRVYVSGARNRPTEVRQLEGSFRAGSARRLEIRVDGEGRTEVNLR